VPLGYRVADRKLIVEEEEAKIVRLLGAAAQRGDHFLTFPEGRRLAAARQAANTLVTAGLAREVRALGEAPVWRRDRDGERAFALKLTTAGTKAFAALADDGEGGSRHNPEGGVGTEPQKPERPSRRIAKGIVKEQAPASITAPRSGTKIDHVKKMVRRPEGATLEAIVRATGWLPHTTYAALTGLRKRGYALERSRNDQVGPAIYRLAPPSQTSA
jgi:Protein of unknown function (DUF3489)